MGNCHGLGFKGQGSGVGISWFFGFGEAAKTNLVRDFSFFFTSSLFACSSVCLSVPPDLIVRPRFGVWGLGSRRNKLVSVTFVLFFYIVVRLRSRLSVHPTVPLVLNHSSTRPLVQLHASEANLFLRFSFLCLYAALPRSSVHSSVPSIRPLRPFEGPECLRA